ncbi:MAG: hypothetical protein KDA86_21500 [Planctomycetaceae bacterium]|nr:hypothetical protein [Planctomycetaceae bacterium]
MFDIPADLYSEYSGSPFDTCIDCGTALLDAETPYVIVKNIVAGETVFEMAICLFCTMKLQQEYSEESMQAIRAWSMEQAQKVRGKAITPARLDHPPQHIHTFDADEAETAVDDQSIEPHLDLNHCQLCGTSRTQAHRYIMEAICVGRRLIQAREPSLIFSFSLLVCEKCTEGMSELISQKTRDQWNRFVEDHFDGPPEIEIDPSGRDLMLV